MPLIKGKSNKAFEHNVKAEMHAGKPQDQSLAIAYSVKRRPKKKASGGTVESGSSTMNYADGGEIRDRETAPMNIRHARTALPQQETDTQKAMKRVDREVSPMVDTIVNRKQPKTNPMEYAEGGAVKSASNESRPTTKEENNDRHQIARQNAAKSLDPKQDMTSPANRTAALKGMKTQKITQPKMVPSNAFSTRLYDEEGNLQESASTNEGPQQQPRKVLDEEGADRQGPKQTPTDARHMGTSTPAHKHTADRDMQRVNSPSEDEGTQDADSKNEQDPNRQGPAESSTQSKTGAKPTHGLSTMAEGGRPEAPHGVDEIVPDKGYGKIIIMKAGGGMLEHEIKDEHDNSIAAAIMAKKAMASGGTVESGSSTMNMAKGGKILSMNATDMTDDDQVDLSRNAQEDNNHEDQLSFDALRKENYSESDGLNDLTQPTDSNETGDDREDATSDKHDMADQIRRKMKSRRQMPTE